MKEQIANAAATTEQNNVTARERQVVKLVAEGMTNKAVADCLKISPRTAEAHRANAMRKLGARNASDIVRWAIAQRLVDVNRPPNAPVYIARDLSVRPPSTHLLDTLRPCASVGTL